MSLQGMNNEQKIWNYLKSKGLNDYGIAGMMGNIFCESGLQSNNLQNNGNRKLGVTDDEFVVMVDSGTYSRATFINDGFGMGICQWTYKTRKAALYDFAKSKNASIADLEMQLEFLYKELSESYKTVLNELKCATSVLAASNAVLTKFERPADMGTAVQTKRASYGQTYYNKYAKKAPVDGVNTMTESELRKQVANWLVQYLGIKEGSAQHKAILAVYNNSKLCPRYTMTTSDAWCATAVSAAFIACGLAGAAGSGKLFQCVKCSCNNMIAKAKTQGIWVENDAYVPKVGDVILYDWKDSGVGDNTGSSDHVGIVYSISGSTIKVIEGNKSNTVAYRTLSVNGRYIRGYITPNYAKFAGTTTTPSPIPETPAIETNTSFPAVPFMVKVLISDLNYRSAGSMSGKVLGQTGKGSFTITEVNADGWGKLKSGAGWIYLKNASYCTIGKTVADSKPTTFTAYKVKVTADVLNIRKGAGTNYGTNGVIKDKGIYTIVAESDGKGATKWGKLKSGAGWISLDWCKKV